MKIGISRAIVLFFLMFSASFAQNLSSTPEKLGIAVLDFESGVLVPTENQVLSEKFRGELLSSGKFRVMERGQMDAILREQGFQQSGACTSQECIVQMGQLLGVDKMIAGTIGKLGDTYLVSARIIDLQTGQIEKMVSEECACRLEKLLPVMSTVSQKLAGLSKAPESLPPPSGSPSPTLGQTAGSLVAQITDLTMNSLRGNPEPQAQPAVVEAPKPLSPVEVKPWLYYAVGGGISGGPATGGLFGNSDSSLPSLPGQVFYRPSNAITGYGAWFQVEIPFKSWFRGAITLGTSTYSSRQVSGTDTSFQIGSNIALNDVQYAQTQQQALFGLYFGFGKNFWWYVHGDFGGCYYTGNLNVSTALGGKKTTTFHGWGSSSQGGLGVRYQGWDRLAISIESFGVSTSVSNFTVQLPGQAEKPLNELNVGSVSQVSTMNLGFTGMAISVLFKFGSKD